MLVADKEEDQDGREQRKENRRPLGIGGGRRDLGAHIN
jgi:hypothetical protein